MKPLHFTILLLFTTQTQATPILRTQDLKDLPHSTQSILNRYEACLHFAGKINSETKPNNFMKHQIKKHNCSCIDQDISRLRHRSYHNTQVINALKKIETEYDISR